MRHGSRQSAVLRHESLQWIGHRSYAIYLWHWPALVLAEAKWGPLSLPQRFVAVGVAVVLAAVSLRLIEDPVRHSTWVASRPARGLALGASLCAAIVVIGTISLGAAAAARLGNGRPLHRCWRSATPTSDHGSRGAAAPAARSRRTQPPRH